MALEVGSVYLSATLDGEGIEKGLADVRGAAEASLEPIGGLMERAFMVKPTFDLAQMAGGVYAGVEQASLLIGPVIDQMGALIGVRCAEAIAKLATITGYVGGGFTKEWNGAWFGVGEGFKATWKGIGNFFTGIMNGVIGGINTALSGLNKLHIQMPSWMGGGSFGFNLPMIANVPYLAQGGVVTQPTLAMIGEAGGEAVLPLRRNTEWMADLADGIGAAIAARGMMGNERGGDFGGVVNLYIDGRRFAEAAIEHFAQAADRRGIDLAVHAAS